MFPLFRELDVITEIYFNWQNKSVIKICVIFLLKLSVLHILEDVLVKRPSVVF